MWRDRLTKLNLYALPRLILWRDRLMKLQLHAPGLAGQLAVVTGVLVAVAVGAMYVFGVGSLRGLAETEAITRVELAATAAREELRQTREDLLTAARILGERPPLQRLLSDPLREPLLPILVRSCTSVALDVCALVRGQEVLAATSNDIEWSRVLTAAAEQGESFLVTGATEDTGVAGAAAAMLEHPGVTVFALRRMDAAFAARLSERVGLDISIVDYQSYRPGEGPLAVLNTDALSRGEPVSTYIASLDTYAATLPVATATGEIVALLQALLPTSRRGQTMTSWRRKPTT